MNRNLFQYLLKQSVLKSLQAAAVGVLIFSLLALLVFGWVRDFPAIGFRTGTLDYGIYMLVLFAGCVVVGGVCFAIGLYWKIMFDGFSTEKILRYAFLAGICTRLGSSILSVEPFGWANWQGFLIDHPQFDTFFYLVLLLIAGSAGSWAGLQLKRELIRKEAREPDLFAARWEKMDRGLHLRIFWYGSGGALLSALVANLIFGVFFEVFIFLSSAGSSEFMLMNIVFVSGLGTAIAGFPAVLGGYALAGLIYQDICSATATRKSSFLKGSILGGLVAFGVCLFGGLCLANIQILNFSIASFIMGNIPYIIPIILATLLAGLAGGSTGVLLFNRIRSWQP